MWHTRTLLTRTGIFLGLLLCLLAGGARSARAAQTWAVLIGVSDYRNRNTITPLGGAANDARALRRILRERLRVPDTNIQLLIAEQGSPANADRSEILSALERLRFKVKPDDTIWLFFAGHGVSVGGRTYLLPSDTSLLTDAALVDTALPVEKVRSVLNTIPARARILLFDMCRSKPRMGARGENSANPLTSAVARSLDFTPAPPPGNPKKQTPITVTLFACSPEQQSYEWLTKGRGFFSYFLEEGLAGKAANTKRQVTVGGLTDYVRTTVKKAVREEMNLVQEPLDDVKGPNAAGYVLATVTPGAAWVPGGDGPPGAPGGGTASAGGVTTAGGDPLPALDDKSARMEFYTNDPSITAVINGIALTSGGARTEPTFDGAPRQFLFQGKMGASFLPTQYNRSLLPGESDAFIVLKLAEGSTLRIRGWPSLTEFNQMSQLMETGDEKKARKGLSSGDWELNDFKIRAADQFTQTLYNNKHSVASADPARPDTPQKVVIVEGNLRNKSREQRFLYTLRVEGDSTILPFEVSALTDKKQAVFPLVAQDADTGNNMEMAFDGGQRRPVRWIFRVPKDTDLKAITRVRLGLLWRPREHVLQRAQFVIERK